MQLFKSSVLVVFAVVFAIAVVCAAPQEGSTVAAVTEPSEKEEVTVQPTRVASAPTQPPTLEHSSAPAQAPQEKATKTPEVPVQAENASPSTAKPADMKGSATSYNQAYSLVFSTVGVVLLSAYSLV